MLDVVPEPDALESVVGPVLWDAVPLELRRGLAAPFAGRFRFAARARRSCCCWHWGYFELAVSEFAALDEPVELPLELEEGLTLPVDPIWPSLEKYWYGLLAPTPREWIRDIGLPPFATLIRASAGPRSMGPQCRPLGITTKAQDPCSPLRPREHCYRLWSGTIKRLRFPIANVPASLLVAFNYRLGPAHGEMLAPHKDVCRPDSRPSFTCLPLLFHRFHFPQPPIHFANRAGEQWNR